MRDLNVLDNKFREKLELVIKLVEKKGYKLVPFSTRRDPYNQAILWRQSRTWKEVKQKIDYLKKRNCKYLVNVFNEVGPQSGRWATNAPPGFSWHQYDKACDCFVLENGRAIWNIQHKGYLTYYETCQEVGLYSGYRFDDGPHCQKEAEQVSHYYSLTEIDKIMKLKYG